MTDQPELEPLDIDGHSMEELAEYVDAGRSPRNPSIESSPACVLAIEALERLRASAGPMLDAEGAAAPPQAGWIADVLTRIGLEARAGRPVPIRGVENAEVTEGALRAVVREVVDGLGGLLARSVRFEGDVERADASVRAVVEVDVRWPTRIPDAVVRLRTAVAAELENQAGLVVTAVDVIVRDLTVPGGSR